MKVKYALKLFSILIIFTPALSALSSAAIVARMEKAAAVPGCRMLYRQVIKRASGSRSVFKIESFTMNGNEKQLLRYLHPAKVKGTAFLILNSGDDIWAYFSATGRVRRIARHARRQKMMGSDFTYEDMSMTAFKEKYKAELLGEDKVFAKACYKLKLIPKERSSYAKLIVWTDKKLFVPLLVNYYAAGEKTAYKQFMQGKIKVINSYPVARMVIMKNLEDNSQTIMQVLQVEMKPNINEDMFVPSYLKR
ncbi:MAG TPA: outer membrane lipoprotein-sorting protein [Spirochaetota bacterium]|nr:outer membrane lipoprotein-sorting protein [Spirochaetota bacterium]